MKHKLLILLAAVSCAVCINAQATSGTCGENLQWSYDTTTNVLTITGSGAMSNFFVKSAPWYNYCTSIQSVFLPDGLTSIGRFAFYNCTGLTSITIPNSVTNIRDDAFAGCRSLSSLTIPNSVTGIGDGAFYNCSSLTSMTIPSSVTSIGKGAFSGCTSLPVINNIRYADTYLVEAVDKNLTTYTIQSGTKWIGSEAFSRCYSLTSITIPNSVISVGHGAFGRCNGLAAINIPNNVTSIEESAFAVCRALTSITIPSNVTSIGQSAFSSCSGLTRVIVLSETPPTLGDYAFDKVASDCSITVPCVAMEAYKTAWSSYSSMIKSAPSAYHVTLKADANKGYVDAPTLTECGEDSYTMTVVALSGYRFAQWSDGNTDNPRVAAITSDTTFTAEFDYAKSGTCGDNNALHWVYNSTTKTLTISGTGALNSNYTYGLEAPGQMEHLVLDEGVTSVGDKAFKGEASLTTISLCSTLLSVGDSAFAGCKRLEEITLYATRVPDIVAGSFANVGNKQYIYLYVCEGRTNAYLRDEYWGEFNVQVKAASTVTDPITDVTITPTENAAQIVWPANNDASSYSIDISKEGTLICTLTFNANGQLTSIAFAAPGVRHDEAQSAATGFSFTVTSLNPGTTYNYSVIAKNSIGTTIDTKTGTFRTLSPTGIEEVLTNPSAPKNGKVLHNGQIYILRDGKTYDLTGKILQ